MLHPHKERHSRRILIFPNALSRKWRASGSAKRMIKWSNLEHPPFGRDLTDFIIATSSQPKTVREIKEQSDQIHLSIMHWSNKRSIPLKIVIKKLHMIHHQSHFTASNTKKLQKVALVDDSRTTNHAKT